MFKQKRDKGFFDEELRLAKISRLSDPLQKLDQVINWELFRSTLEEGLRVQAKGKGGRRPYDYVMMFKILILQRYYNLSDDKLEFQILDRLSFMRFLDLALADDVPDSKTIWHFRERLTQTNLTEQLFDLFKSELNRLGMIVQEGKIVDASFVEVPKQRNSREENQEIKSGRVPEEWENNPNKIRQKDTDARWTKKNNQSYYGYKNHVKCDQKNKLIENYIVTHAAVHDSQTVEDLLEDSDVGKELYADSAYSGENVSKVLKKEKVSSRIMEKASRDNPLTDHQKESNRAKSSIRVRVEHIFGFIENSMNGSRLRCIGIMRSSTQIGLINLTYNMFRYEFLLTQMG